MFVLFWSSGMLTNTCELQRVQDVRGQQSNPGHKFWIQLKHSKVRTALVMWYQDQDHYNMAQIRDWDQYCKFKTYLSRSLFVFLLLMRSFQPWPKLGPKPTNSIGWTNHWLTLPLMRYMLVSGATKQQTALSLAWTFYAENTRYRQNM